MRLVKSARGTTVKKKPDLILVLLAIFGLGFVSLAIQQAEINGFYGSNPDL